MEKEILEQYNKVKDILSEEEFLAEMDDIRETNKDIEFYDEINIAQEVVKNHLVLLKLQRLKIQLKKMVKILKK